MTTAAKRLFWIWCDMRARCSSPKHRAYPRYGGRGIFVCDRWKVFSAFAADMGERPNGMSLDRRDNDGPYSPENCRWATRAQQNGNRRNCIYVDLGGERVTLKEYCRTKNLPYRAIVKRIQDRRWPVDLALTAPIGARRRRVAA